MRRTHLSHISPVTTHRDKMNGNNNKTREQKRRRLQSPRGTPVDHLNCHPGGSSSGSNVTRPGAGTALRLIITNATKLTRSLSLWSPRTKSRESCSMVSMQEHCELGIYVAPILRTAPHFVTLPSISESDKYCSNVCCRITALRDRIQFSWKFKSSKYQFKVR